MKRLLTFALLLIGTSGVIFAAPVPEIDPASGGAALALLGSALLIIRSRKRQGFCQDKTDRVASPMVWTASATAGPGRGRGAEEVQAGD